MPRSAEEVAEEIIVRVGFKPKSYPYGFIVQALTAYAEERVKDAEKQWNQVRSCAECRAEALEEAAKIAEAHAVGGKLCNDPAHDDRYCGTCEAMRDEADVLEQTIRAMKEKP